ncbi:MAG: S-layer homology domain-containing protein [Clostridia bacterium]|nr:S-layer homology domain-containing protein [Clostridia bacterium]
MKKLITIIMTIVILASFTMTSFAITFNDVAENAWYKSYVYDLAEKGIINGYEENGASVYKPDKKVTVAEFTKLIIAASAPTIKYNLIEPDFEHWAAKYVKVAENFGVLEDDEYTLEDMNREITRIEVVKILSRCDIMVRENGQKSSDKVFTDTQELDGDQIIYLNHAVGIGVISGDPEGTFRPNDGLKRSESAKIIYTYLNGNN